jgi:hypothetical protein
MHRNTELARRLLVAVLAFDRLANDVLLTSSDDVVVRQAWTIKVTPKRAPALRASDGDRLQLLRATTMAIGRTWRSQRAAA